MLEVRARQPDQQDNCVSNGIGEVKYTEIRKKAHGELIVLILLFR